VSFNQQATTRIAIRDGRALVENWDWGREDNRLVVKGGVSLAGSPQLDVTATTALDLRLLNAFVPDARLAGRADGELRVSGPAQSPSIDGYVTASGGEARTANPRLVVTDLGGTVTLAGDTLTVERMTASVNGGSAEIAGSLRHQSLTPIAGELTL